MSYYKAFETDTPDHQYHVRAEIRDGKFLNRKYYYYIHAPGVDVRYMVRSDESGVYMGLLKRQIPLFGLSFDVHFFPELLFLKFPLTVGDHWSQQVQAKATILFVPITQTIEGRFQVTAREILHTEAGDIDCFVVKANLGVVNGSMVEKTFRYGKNIGYAKADAPEDFAVLVGYHIFDDENNVWADLSPTEKPLYK